jgi:hypothetical protein
LDFEDEYEDEKGSFFSCDLNPPPLVEDPERFYLSGEK